MRAWNKLSASFVRSVRHEGRYSDGGNLYLQVANGGKSWVFQYQRHGRQRDMGLPGRRGAGTSGCASGPGDRPVARSRRGHRAVRAWTRAARARSGVDRTARKRWPTLSAEYGYSMCAGLLSQNTGRADLERASPN